jgi:hypothetical protein
VGRHNLLVLTDNIDVSIGQQEAMLVAGLTLGHHGVTGLHVAQDQSSLIDLVPLVLGHLCACRRWHPMGPGQSTELC